MNKLKSLKICRENLQSQKITEKKKRKYDRNHRQRTNIHNISRTP